MKVLKVVGVAMILLIGAQHQQASAEEITIDTKSVLNETGLSYVPTKIVTNQLKAPVAWNNQNKTLTIQKQQTTISIKMGESEATVNGKIVPTTPIIVKDGVSYLPLRFVGENLQMEVQWSPESITLTALDTYTVQEGDYLYKISQKTGISIEEIQSINNLKDDKLQIGQVLYVTQNKTKKSDLAPVESSIKNDTIEVFSERNEDIFDREPVKNDKGQEILSNENIAILPSKATDSTIEYTSYVVKQGDTLTDISVENKVSLQDLIATNNLTMTSILQVGDQLVLPKRVIPQKATTSEEFGEYLDWWTEAQYAFPIGDIATVTDFLTGESFQIRRSYGVNHADCEPLTAEDTAIAKSVWGGFTWDTRAVIISTEDRQIAASMSFMPHDIETILDNDFDGHFDIHFNNSTRHKDGKIDPYHQEKIKVAAGVE